MRFIFYVESFYCEIVVEYKKKSKNKKKSVWFVNFCQPYISGESYLEVLIEEKLHCCRPVQKLKDKYTSITQKRILTFDKIQ